MADTKDDATSKKDDVILKGRTDRIADKIREDSKPYPDKK